MPKIDDQLQNVTARLCSAALEAGRDPAQVALVAASKAQPPETILAAYRAGQRRFGENYVQEALDKQRALSHLADIEWHFIGPIQSNKTRAIAEHFAWVHSIDRIKTARRLSRQRPGHMPALQVCLQVNLDGEASKAGVAPEQLEELARAVHALPGLHLRGLMALPEPRIESSAQRQVFARLRGMLEDLNRAGLALNSLSMGMSGDLEAAVAEGATLVRIGSAIFGPRPVKNSPDKNAGHNHTEAP